MIKKHVIIWLLIGKFFGLQASEDPVLALNNANAHAAPCSDNPKILLRLLEAGALVNVRDQYGITPLHRTPLYNAMLHERNENAPILLKLDADTTIADNTGYTSLEVCAQYAAARDANKVCLLAIPAIDALKDSMA